METSKQQKGIRAELLAAIDFLAKPNTHVYYDLGGKGPADIIVVNLKLNGQVKPCRK